MPTQEDFLRILRDHTRHAAHYNVERAAECLYLHFIEGYTYSELAARYGISKGAIQTRMLDTGYKLLGAKLTPYDKELLCSIPKLRKILGW
jgi:DNA-directed RNA polymerase specialized sigma24 family protein